MFMQFLQTFFTWTKSYQIQINGYSFSWLDIWIWCMLAGIIVNFIVRYFRDE